jgi:predicted O-methyltransferase YrrM
MMSVEEFSRFIGASAIGIPGGWERLEKLDGWCTEKKARILCALVLYARPTVCVEIGVFGGKSLFTIASACYEYGGTVHGIDPWTKDEAMVEVKEQANCDFWGTVDLESVYEKCMAARSELGLDACCHIHRTTSEKAAPLFDQVDLLHIDGNHTEKQSVLDATLWLPKVPSGGIVVFDDIDWYEIGQPTTAAAVRVVEASCDRIVRVENYAFFRKR